ncbi:hypothetical protein IMZ48_36985 [Candidatus Bathyarchaeota archaeon]|nr:hypothetical protein [Candidatus Bathyarchaeota archaeon]
MEFWKTVELPPDLRALFKRAIDDPTSITRVELNEIRGLPPPDEEDRIIAEKLPSSSKAELVSKATASPETLTKDEVDYLTHLNSVRRFNTEDDRELMCRAIDATAPSDEQLAVFNSYKRESQLFKEERAEEERKRRRREYLRNLPRAEWVQRMVDADLQRWGFVCFRTAYGTEATSDERWELFKAWYANAGKEVATISKGLQKLWPRHMTLWVSDPTLEGCSTEHLRERFRSMRDAGEIPEGLRTDVFLVADERSISEECIASGKRYSTAPCVMNVFGKANTYRRRVDAPWLTAVDPDHDATATVPTEGPYAGFKGEVPFRLPKAFDWLHYGFFANSDNWRRRYWQTKDIEWAPYKMPYSPYPTYGPEWVDPGASSWVPDGAERGSTVSGEDLWVLGFMAGCK